MEMKYPKSHFKFIPPSNLSTSSLVKGRTQVGVTNVKIYFLTDKFCLFKNLNRDGCKIVSSLIVNDNLINLGTADNKKHGA